MKTPAEMISAAAVKARPYDAAGADELERLAAADMHPRAAMRRVRALADGSRSSAREVLHELADDLGRCPAGPEEIDLHVAAIRRQFGTR